MSQSRQPDLAFEHAARRAGARHPAGVDEVGRGALAGPVVSAAVVLPDDDRVIEGLAGVRDSKTLTAAARLDLVPLIRAASLACAIGQASAAEVDRLGVARATELSMCRALGALKVHPDYLLVDGYPNRLDPRPQRAVVKGDRLVLSIAAASVLAKVWRDAYMIALASRVPGYGLDRHKGYGTDQHRAAIRDRGPSAWHRLSWDLLGTRKVQPSLPGLGLEPVWPGAGAALGQGLRAATLFSGRTDDWPSRREPRR